MPATPPATTVPKHTKAPPSYLPSQAGMPPFSRGFMEPPALDGPSRPTNPAWLDPNLPAIPPDVDPAFAPAPPEPLKDLASFGPTASGIPVTVPFRVSLMTMADLCIRARKQGVDPHAIIPLLFGMVDPCGGTIKCCRGH